MVRSSPPLTGSSNGNTPPLAQGNAKTLMDIQHEINFFDEFAQEHGDYNVLGRYAYKRLLDNFNTTLHPTAAWNVVDLGCGSGAFTRRLAQRFGFHITGIDISPGLIELANREALDKNFESYVVGDLMATGLPDNSVDCVVYSGVLHHLTTPEVRLKALREAIRILKPGGCVWAYDPNWQSPPMWLYRDPASPVSTTRGRTPNEILLKRWEIAAELQQTGFTDVLVRGIAGITFRHIDCPMAFLVIHAYNVYEGLLRFSPLENRWGTFLISSAFKPR
jgi:ubiquinone/menaquinone biosynthesis C-methylase UbiE